MEKGGRIKSATSATYADDILLYSSFMWSFVFPSQSANQYSYLLRNQSKGWEKCLMDLLDSYIFISILYIYYVYLSLVTWHRGSFQSYNCEPDKKWLWVLLIRLKGQWQPLFGAQHSSIVLHVVTIVQIWCFGLWQTCSTFPQILSVNQTGEKMLGCTISHPKPSKPAPTFFFYVCGEHTSKMGWCHTLKSAGKLDAMCFVLLWKYHKTETDLNPTLTSCQYNSLCNFAHKKANLTVHSLSFPNCIQSFDRFC